MKIAVGSDERNATTDAVVRHLTERGLEVELHGPLADGAPERDKQWAEVSEDVARTVASGDAERGVLFCWTGTGCSIAANKVAGIRAVTAHDSYSVERSVLSNNAQVLTMGARVVGIELAKKLVGEWLGHRFDPGSPSAQKVALIEHSEESEQ